MLNVHSTIHSVALICGLVLAVPGQNLSAAGSAGTPSQTATSAAAKATPAIRAAFAKAYPTATIKNVSKEQANGQQTFEVESVANGKTIDVVYLADGSVVEVEEEVTEAALPPAVAMAVKGRYPAATVTKRERLTITKGHVIQYELALKGAKAKEVVLMPDGAWVSPK